MSLLERIFQTPELHQSPPILVDIGASGAIHAKWKSIARFSICIAFDPDRREFDPDQKSGTGFRQLITIPAIVTDAPAPESAFFLTSNPFCSSSLPPDNASLANWAFSNRFIIERQVKLPSITLDKVLRDHNLDKIDWYKSDSQGCDLRIFQSLGNNLTSRVLVAEFEPGIIDAYVGEDKLADTLKYMDSGDFWMSTCAVTGKQRIDRERLTRSLPRLFSQWTFWGLRESPVCAEVRYLNTLRNPALTKRDFLLGWVFAQIERQYGFSLEIAERGLQRFQDNLFAEMRSRSLAYFVSPSAGMGAMWNTFVRGTRKLARMMGHTH